MWYLTPAGWKGGQGKVLERYEGKHKLSPQVCKVVAESLVGYLSGLTPP